MKWALVWTGQKYRRKYIEHLRARLPGEIICLTDRPDTVAGVTMIRIDKFGLVGWWAKLLLLNPEIRGSGRTVYLDLDTVIAGDVSPLAEWDSAPFGICESFTRAAGNTNWPCKYGSCVMSFDSNYGARQFNQFESARDYLISNAGHLGDQKIIERLDPDAALLQGEMPPGFFLGRREIEKNTKANPGCALVIFAGRKTPENCTVQWIKDLWK